MLWPTWQHATIATVVCIVSIVALKRCRPSRTTEFLLPAFRELRTIFALYALWRTAKKLPLTQTEGAIDRALQVVDVQEAMFLPSELVVQEWVLRWDWLGWASSAYYAGVHAPAMIAFLLWLFLRHRDQFGKWRNALALLTAMCLFIRFVRVAPPRHLPELGFVDVSVIHGMDVYGPIGTGVSAQFVAMPSLHVAWAAVVGFGVIGASSSRWRWLVAAHLPITIFVVSATGHHWWLDGIVAIVLLGCAMLIDVVSRALLARWFPSATIGSVADVSSELKPPDVEPVPVATDG